MYLQVPFNAAFNQAKAREDGRAQWGADFRDINEHEEGENKFLRLYFFDGASVTQQAAETFVAAHNANSLTANQLRDQRINAAVSSMDALLSGLGALTAEDAAYAAMGRAMAIKDGASQGTINGIVDRASAAAYVTGKPEWVNLTAVSKAWMTDQLDMMAMLYQVIIITLRR